MQEMHSFVRAGGRAELDSMPAQFFWTAPMLVLLRIFEAVDTETLIEWLTSDELYEYRFLGGPFPADRTNPRTLYRNAIYKQNAGMRREPDVMRMLLEREYGLTSNPEKSQCLLQFRERSTKAFADWMRKIGSDVAPLRELLFSLLFEELATIVRPPDVLHGGIVFTVDAITRTVVWLPLLEYMRKVPTGIWAPVVAIEAHPPLLVGSSVSLRGIHRGMLFSLDLVDGNSTYDVMNFEGSASLYRQTRVREPDVNTALPLFRDYECTVQLLNDGADLGISYTGAFEASYTYTQNTQDDAIVISVHRADYVWESVPLSIVVIWEKGSRYGYTLISLSVDKQFRRVSYDIGNIVDLAGNLPKLILVSRSTLRIEFSEIKTLFVKRNLKQELVRRLTFNMVLLDLETGVGRHLVWIGRSRLIDQTFVPPRCARRADGLQRLATPPNVYNRVQAGQLV